MKRTKIFTSICFILIFSITLMPSIAVASTPYETSIDFGGATIAFDIYHGGYHATLRDLSPIKNNLTAAGNVVIFINETWELSDAVDVLFLTQSDDHFTSNQLEDIKNWFTLGDKLLWVSGDSDYGGYYNEEVINIVLGEIGAISRIDSTEIRDQVFNDGASYRVAAPYVGVGDPLYDQVAEEICTGIEAGVILHGSCSIIAYDGYNYTDLRYGHSIFPERVMTLMTYSENATARDSDSSAGDLDLYAGELGGLFPAIVYENMTEYDSHLIVSGEAIYTIYKDMYNQYTENGVYNSGLHYGQLLVNNILNYLIDKEFPITTTPPPTTPTESPTFNVNYQSIFFVLTTLCILPVILIRKKK